jgi:voltage-gated potassium channel Kch
MADQSKSADHHLRLSQHVIVVGMNTLGRDIVRRLCQRGETVIAIDTDPMKLKDLPCRTLHGSVEYLTVLEEAGYDRAKLLISALSIEHVNDILAHRCQLAKVPCAVHVVDVSVADSLLDLGAAYLMIPKVDGLKAQVRKLKEMGVIPT